jgi:hypothetical protein
VAHWPIMVKASLSRRKPSTARPPPSVKGRRQLASLLPPTTSAPSRKAAAARRKFLCIFPDGFRDEDYLDLERGYKWDAHVKWEQSLNEPTFRMLLEQRKYNEISVTAIRIESRTNLLFSFEKMALRDAVRTPTGSRAFAIALFNFLHGAQDLETRFTEWVESVDCLPRRQTRVLTWPIVTVFGFLAQPRSHFFLKPTVTREAAGRYGVDLPYASRPSWDIYKKLLEFVGQVRRDIKDLRPRDMIDLQSFLWVQGSEEYSD